MQLLPIRTPILHEGDDPLASVLLHIQPEDIVVFSSKAIAVTEGATIDLHTLSPTEEAERWSERCGRDATFCEAVLQEGKRLNGRIIGHCPGALFTEVRPSGLQIGVILTANAGLDESNVQTGTTVGWPHDPAQSSLRLSTALCHHTQSRVGVIVSDSCLRPRRSGLTAFALTCTGVDPFLNRIGEKDLYDRALRMSIEATADQLATAANMLMGNGGSSIPAVIVRDHGLIMSDFHGWVDGIEPSHDLFGASFTDSPSLA